MIGFIVKNKTIKLNVIHFVVGRFTVVIVYNRSKRLWYKRCCPTIVGKLDLAKPKTEGGAMQSIA